MTRILIDTSYFVFYRFFATLRWYSFKNPDAAGHARLTQDPVFMEAFFKHAGDTIAKICKQWRVGADDLVFCRDCARADIWRNAIYPEYKGTRVTADNFDGEIFSRFYDFAEARGWTQRAVPSLEADDVVYLEIRRMRDGGDADTPIVCYSNDNDYLQLRSFPNVTIMNLQGKDLASRSCGCPQKDMILKVLLGDKSDNIPAIVGPKKAKLLADMSEEARCAAISGEYGADTLANYHRNRQLIDFACIPQKMSE